jgi:Prokaryotic Cytochrome C oxidase subunit IV
VAAVTRRIPAIRVAVVAWLVLVLATWGASRLGQSGANGHGRAVGWVAVTIICVALAKVVVVVEVFMETRTARAWLRLTMLGWSVAVCIGLLAYAGVAP